MRDPREQKSNLPFGGRHTFQVHPEPSGRAEPENSGTPASAYESNLRFAAELEANEDPDMQELGRLVREASSRIVAEWKATLPAEGHRLGDEHDVRSAGQEPEATRPRRSMFEKARDLLGSLGLAGLFQPRSPAAVGSKGGTDGLYDQATDAGPYDGVKVPPPRSANEATLGSPHQEQRISDLENALTTAHRDVSALRRDVGAVMRQLLIAGGMEPEAAEKRAAALLTKGGGSGMRQLDGAAAVEQLPEELRNLKRDVALVMANLLIGSGCPPDQAKEIAVAPLMPKSAKNSPPPEDFGQELEMQRFEQEVDRLCERIFGATEIRGLEPVPELRPRAQEPERRPRAAPTHDRSRDRGHEW